MQARLLRQETKSNKGAQETADKALDAGNQVKRGVQVATEKMVGAGSEAKHGVLAAANKTVEIGHDAKRTAQVAADKVINTGSRAAGGVQGTLVKVADASKGKLLDAKNLADEHWQKFTTEVEDASQRYADKVSEALVLTNNKLKESATAIDREGTVRNKAKKQLYPLVLQQLLPTTKFWRHHRLSVNCLWLLK